MNDDLFAIDGVDALFDLPLAEFVLARDALAKRLRASGDRDAAAAVRQLAKPTVVAWAVNRVAREEHGGVSRLLRLSDEVREAQAQAVRGADAAALRTASRERRELVQQLAQSAARLVGATHRDAAAETIDAASLDADGVNLLRAGRLTKALAPSASFGLAGMPDPPEPPSQPGPERRPRPAPTRPRPPKRDEAALQRAKADLDAAESALASAEVAVTTAEARLDEALRALEDARAERDAARAAREAAAASVARAQADARP